MDSYFPILVFVASAWFRKGHGAYVVLTTGLHRKFHWIVLAPTILTHRESE